MPIYTSVFQLSQYNTNIKDGIRIIHENKSYIITLNIC